MPEAEITRKQVIEVGEVGENSYGDLTFTDKSGKEYKVGNKRRQYFDKVILSGVTVQLNYSKFRGKEYIYNADLIILPSKAMPTADKPQQALQSKSSPVKEVSGSKPLTKEEQIERAVWIKELGECLRSGNIDKTNPRGQSLITTYYTEMSRVLGIDIKEVKPLKSSLVEEARN